MICPICKSDLVAGPFNCTYECLNHKNLKYYLSVREKTSYEVIFYEVFSLYHLVKDNGSITTELWSERESTCYLKKDSFYLDFTDPDILSKFKKLILLI